MTNEDRRKGREAGDNECGVTEMEGGRQAGRELLSKEGEKQDIGKSKSDQGRKEGLRWKMGERNVVMRVESMQGGRDGLDKREEDRTGHLRGGEIERKYERETERKYEREIERKYEREIE